MRLSTVLLAVANSPAEFYGRVGNEGAMGACVSSPAEPEKAALPPAALPPATVLQASAKTRPQTDSPARRPVPLPDKEPARTPEDSEQPPACRPASPRPPDPELPDLPPYPVPPAPDPVPPAPQQPAAPAPCPASPEAEREPPPVEFEMTDLSELQQQKVVGKGSSGNVFQCIHTPTGVTVCIKQVPISLKAADQESVLQSLRDIYRSKHPNVTAFHGAAYDGHSIVIAFEYMHHRSVKDVLKKLGMYVFVY